MTDFETWQQLLSDETHRAYRRGRTVTGWERAGYLAFAVLTAVAGYWMGAMG